MTRPAALPVPPRTHRDGFTLTEIVLALAVIATAFIAVLGLLPTGLDASKQAADTTVIASILEETHNRLQGQPLVTSAKAPALVAFFDDHGAFIPESAAPADLRRRLYRAEVRIGTWKTPLANLAASKGSSLRPVTIALSWPVNPQTGAPLGKDNPKTVVTYAVTALTGTDWKSIDTSYVPKIEF